MNIIFSGITKRGKLVNDINFFLHDKYFLLSFLKLHKFLFLSFWKALKYTRILVGARLFPTI